MAIRVVNPHVKEWVQLRDALRSSSKTFPFFIVKDLSDVVYQVLDSPQDRSGTSIACISFHGEKSGHVKCENVHWHAWVKLVEVDITVEIK